MQVADQFLQGKQQMGHMCDQLNRQMMFVQGGWDGLTSQRFFQDFQRSQQSMSVTLERLSTVAQELIFISKSFTQIDGEKVILNVPGNGLPVQQTASSGEGWLHKIFEQIGQAEITKAEAQIEASKLQGEILWDTAQGAKGAVQEDLTLGMLPDKDRDYNHPMAAKVGEILGHVATTLQGAGEVIVGAGGEGLSVAVSSTGVGSIIGIPGLIGSAALVTHGGTTAVKSASGIGRSSSELLQMIKGEGGGSSKQTLTSNKGTPIDVTPSSNHTSTITNPHPAKGEPNSSVDILDKNTGEIKTRRYYDENGRAIRDVDYTNHGNSKQHPEWPHEHVFEWKEDGTFKRVNKK
ncbi:WXG100 family type VII secretion target [Paenibacillus sp. BJ-4]|uniref:WXG100 family type VII secretion target n=1 Tax=Paenibacillus sp. BJ-4 TaxID=2878097 RepID=UPI0039A6FB12